MRRRIVKTALLIAGVFILAVVALLIAQARSAGQFILTLQNISTNSEGERSYTFRLINKSHDALVSQHLGMFNDENHWRQIGYEPNLPAGVIPQRKFLLRRGESMDFNYEYSPANPWERQSGMPREWRTNDWHAVIVCQRFPVPKWLTTLEMGNYALNRALKLPLVFQVKRVSNVCSQAIPASAAE